jgi:hypothetical protein
LDIKDIKNNQKYESTNNLSLPTSSSCSNSDMYDNNGKIGDQTNLTSNTGYLKLLIVRADSIFNSRKLFLNFFYFNQILDNEMISHDCENHIQNSSTTIHNRQIHSNQHGQIVIEKYENGEIENTQTNTNNNSVFLSHQHNYINSNINSHTKNIHPSNNDDYKSVKSNRIISFLSKRIFPVEMNHYQRICLFI